MSVISLFIFNSFMFCYKQNRSQKRAEELTTAKRQHAYSSAKAAYFASSSTKGGYNWFSIRSLHTPPAV